MLQKVLFDVNCDECGCPKIARWQVVDLNTLVDGRPLSYGKFCSFHAAKQQNALMSERMVSDAQTTRPETP